MLSKNEILCWFDGACGPKNPSGYMGWGAIVQYYDRCEYGYDGRDKNDRNTNNVAEYNGLLMILKMIKKVKGMIIVIRGDSNMVVNQMNNDWRIKEGMYKYDAIDAMNKLREIKKYNKVRLEWIPREENTDADELSNEGIKKINPEYAGFKPYFKRKKC